MKKRFLGRRMIAIWVAAALALPIAYGSASSSSYETTEKAGFEEAAVIEVELADRDEVDRLVETGVDLTHEIHVHGSHIDAQVVVTPSEAADLRAQGFELGKVLWTEADSRAVLAQRREVIRENRQEARAFGIDATGYTEPVTKPSTKQLQADELLSGDQSLSAAETDQLVIARADYFQSSQGHFISVEAKTDLAQTATLTLEWDEGPGTPIGSGGSINMQSFVDAGTYMYHRRQIGVDDRPEYIRVTSSGGATATMALDEWLPLPEDDPGEDPLMTGFVDHYMDATELMDRFEQLAAEFPEIAEIVELPYKTNGYRRKSQATIGSTGGGGAAAVVVESHDWGHEGGDNLSVQFVNPGAANSPLSVSVVGGTLIRVSLATDVTGALTSTAAQVVAAINASGQASQLVRSFNYRGSAGGGIVQAAGPVQLSDFLNAPDYVSHEPFQNKILRIGKFRNGSRPGVLAYSQEHAREWQTPLVTTEFAERLLRNYAHNEDIKKLVNQHEIFVAPSINPDGSHYSFHDFGSQRRTMTRHCDDNNNDPGRRNAWGVDTNRNYPTGSLFDGYSGASSSCTSDVYSGPAELSEPENRNLVWIPQTFDNITHAMNIHSSGNYFMWSPGAYILPGRITLPRPTLGEENYFWESSKRILTEIKKWRGTVVTPARTGPIADVLYSAAGNSGDHLWYGEDLYAWNFEVGTSFQPSWPEAGHQANEFANGLLELLAITNDFSKDKKTPTSTVSPKGGNYSGPVEVSFSWDEPVSIYYTLDGSRPTFDSPTLESKGIREGAETLTITETTTLKWFAIDAKGNIENGYDPNKQFHDKFNKETYKITDG